MQRGEFREDLYYRLNVLTITIPLRERPQDIMPLTELFVARFADEQGRGPSWRAIWAASSASTAGRATCAS